MLEVTFFADLRSNPVAVFEQDVGTCFQGIGELKDGPGARLPFADFVFLDRARTQVRTKGELFLSQAELFTALSDGSTEEPLERPVRLFPGHS